jgi:hypothetical protein
MASLDLLPNSLLQLDPDAAMVKSPQENGVVGHRAANGDLFVLGTPALFPADPAALTPRAVTALLIPQSRSEQLQIVEFWVHDRGSGANDVLPPPTSVHGFSGMRFYPTSALVEAELIPPEALAAYGCSSSSRAGVSYERRSPNYRASALAECKIHGDVVVIMPIPNGATNGLPSTDNRDDGLFVCPLQLRPEWLQARASRAKQSSSSADTTGGVDGDAGTTDIIYSFIHCRW